MLLGFKEHVNLFEICFFSCETMGMVTDFFPFVKYTSNISYGPDTVSHLISWDNKACFSFTHKA